jgi:hypothetical protein
VPLFVAGMSILLTLPSLGVGLILDDYYHRSVLLARTPLGRLLGPPSSMFRFFRGDGDRTRQLIDIGLFPWWTDRDIKAEFLQALTVLTHRLDYALWPNSPALMHAQNVFWLGAAAAVTAILYRRIMGATAVAGVAAVLFALDDARGATVGFIANRNVLIAATFGVSALIAHDRWRREGSRSSAFLAPVLLLAALFSKEEGIGTCAYFAAYGLFADRAGRLRGLLALAPSAATVVAWRALRTAWGYGVENAGIYMDPLSDPGRFTVAAIGRAPILLLGQWTPVQADLGIVLAPGNRFWLWLAALVFLMLLFVALAPLLRRDRLARFWTAGMLFATVPVCATFPMDRLLTFVGIGASGLLAQFLADALGSGSKPEADAGQFVAGRFRRQLTVVLAWFLACTHLVIAPLLLPFRAANPIGPAWVEARLYVQTPLGRELADRTIVVVNAPSPAHAGYLILRREANGESIPKYTRVLAPAAPSVTITRRDDRTLAVRPRRGYQRWPLDQVFRSEQRPLRLGEQVRLSGMTATVAELTEDGRPAEVTFQFDAPLESPKFLWLCYRGNRFEAFRPPEVDRQSVIPFDWKAVLTLGSS